MSYQSLIIFGKQLFVFYINRQQVLFYHTATCFPFFLRLPNNNWGILLIAIDLQSNQ